MWEKLLEAFKSLRPLLEKGIALLAGFMLGKANQRAADLEKNQEARREADIELDAIRRLDDPTLDERLRNSNR